MQLDYRSLPSYDNHTQKTWVLAYFESESEPKGALKIHLVIMPGP